MPGLFYSTGQVARQLGTTLAAIRLLCEKRLIAAETSPGGHWRVPASEVERLKRDGLPPMPRPLPNPSAPAADHGTSNGHGYPEFVEEPSDEVALAADRVVITRSTLEQRKIEREIEENEDWFRDRERRQAEAKAAARQKAEANQAEQRYQEWVQEWTQYALNSLPLGARQEFEMEVYTAAQQALSLLQAGQPRGVTQRLVDAAVHRALAPWTRKQEIERAIAAGMNKLGWNVQHRSEYAALKQRAWDAAVAAVRRVRAEASYQEMETAAVQAVQPMVRESEHQQACERMVGRLYLFDLDSAEWDPAKEAVRKALEKLPVGAEAKSMERAQEAALASFKAAVATRKEKARLESENQFQRRVAEMKADCQLGHISKYVQQEYTFDGGDWARLQEVNRLRPLIRETLIDELLEHPNMTADEIRESIEVQIDHELDT
jgi:hypothetical protein